MELRHLLDSGDKRFFSWNGRKDEFWKENKKISADVRTFEIFLATDRGANSLSRKSYSRETGSFAPKFEKMIDQQGGKIFFSIG